MINLSKLETLKHVDRHFGLNQEKHSVDQKQITPVQKTNINASFHWLQQLLLLVIHNSNCTIAQNLL